MATDQEQTQVSAALNEFYSQRPGGYAQGNYQAEWDAYASFVTRYTKQSARVLEIGSGSWRCPYTLFQHGLDVEGCDVWSEEILAEQIHQMPVPGPRLIRYDGWSLPYPDQTFDTVCSHTVFEHLLNPDGVLSEVDRVLRVGGRQIILAPNLSGPSGPIRALQARLVRNDRWWQYETVVDALVGLGRSFLWPLIAQVSDKPRFFYIFPRMRDGQIAHERSDDDAVHLCCPVSFRKWFTQHGYRLLKYNRGEGKSRFARLFNSLFPSWATTVVIVAEKQ